MNHLNVKWTGLAVGITLVIVYSLCALVLSLIGHDTAVAVINGMMHSLDVTAVVTQTHVPVISALLGAVAWFIIGWLIGATFATIYNAGTKNLKVA